MELTAHFDEKEFICNCGCDEVSMDSGFIDLLEKARVLARIPFKITSGFRCPQYNERVGGVDGSAHTVGKGSDIFARDSNARLKIVKAVIEAGFTRIGLAETFIHVDNDEEKPAGVMWLY